MGGLVVYLDRMRVVVGLLGSILKKMCDDHHANRKTPDLHGLPSVREMCLQLEAHARDHQDRLCVRRRVLRM